MRSLLTAAAMVALSALGGCWINESITPGEIISRVEAAPYDLPAGITPLSEQEIRSRVIGNTLASMASDNSFEVAEYLHPNGSVRAAWADRHAAGFWAVSRSLLCLYYPDRLLAYPPRSASMFHCYTLVLDGDSLGFYDQDGRALEIRSVLLPGNAWNL